MSDSDDDLPEIGFHWTSSRLGIPGTANVVTLSSDDEKTCEQTGGSKKRKQDFYSSGSEDDEFPTVGKLLGTAASNTSNLPSVPSKTFSMSDLQCGMKRQATSISEMSYGNKSEKLEKDVDKLLKKEIKDKEREEKKKQKEHEKRLKDEVKAKKAAEREAKKREKEMESIKRKAILQSRRNCKPGECLKFMTVMLDTRLMQSGYSRSILEELQKHDVRYEVQQQGVDHMISFWREVTQMQDDVQYGVSTKTSEKLEQELVVLLPLADFVNMVDSYHQERSGCASGVTLKSYVNRIRLQMENRQLTIVVQGIEKYFREQKIRKADVEHKRKMKKNTVLTDVSKMQVEEALIDVQIHENCNVRLVEKDEEIGKIVFQFTKAIAETPFKQERLKSNFSFHLECGNSVKIEKDGRGVQQCWRQMLQQFKAVTADVANAIIKEYPTPWQLHQAYESCTSQQQSEALLQDILIRRGVGVTETTRRVGKELSRRLHELFTVRDSMYVIR